MNKKNISSDNRLIKWPFILFLLGMIGVVFSLLYLLRSPNPWGSFGFFYITFSALSLFPIWIGLTSILILLAQPKSIIIQYGCFIILSLSIINSMFFDHSFSFHSAKINTSAIPGAPTGRFNGSPSLNNYNLNLKTLNITENIESAPIQQLISGIDQRLTAHHLVWQDAITPTSFIGGFRQGMPLYICRASFKGGYQIGFFLNNYCELSYGGRAVGVENFQILGLLKSSTLIWSFNPSNAMPLVALGAEQTPQGNRILYACLTEINGEIALGKIIKGHCNIAVKDLEVILPIKAVLTLPGN